jgi:large subunit ribosomal protein L25
MAKEIQLAAQPRTTSGSANARRLRRSGMLPGNICDEKGQAKAVQVNTHEFITMLHHHTGENLIVNLTVEGQGVRKVLMRDIQRDAVRDDLQHVDFVEISMTRKMRVTIPVTFIGEAVGVTQGGGILEHVLRELEVECLPGDLVDSIPVDISSLALGGRLLVRDMQIPAQLTVLTTGDQPVAIVSIPKAEEVVVPEAAEAATTEPELIKKKKEEEGEAAAEGDKKGAKKPDEKKPEEKKGDDKKAKK